MSFFSNLIKGPVNDLLDTVQTKAPATIDTALTTATTTLTGSVEQAVALFRRAYTSSTTRIAGWLPTTKPWITTKVAALVTWAKAQAKKL